MAMTKFNADNDPGFAAIAGELRRWEEELEMVPGTSTYFADTLVSIVNEAAV